MSLRSLSPQNILGFCKCQDQHLDLSQILFYRSGCFYKFKILLLEPSPTGLLREARNGAQSPGFPHSGVPGIGEHKRESGDITLANPWLVLAHFPQVGTSPSSLQVFTPACGIFSIPHPFVLPSCASSLRSSVKSLP